MDTCILITPGALGLRMTDDEALKTIASPDNRRVYCLKQVRYAWKYTHVTYVISTPD